MLGAAYRYGGIDGAYLFGIFEPVSREAKKRSSLSSAVFVLNLQIQKVALVNCNCGDGRIFWRYKNETLVVKKRWAAETQRTELKY